MIKTRVRLDDENRNWVPYNKTKYIIEPRAMINGPRVGLLVYVEGQPKGGDWLGCPSRLLLYDAERNILGAANRVLPKSSSC